VSIKSENRKLYPRDWKAIRSEVLERAGDKCEWCERQNYGWIDESGMACSSSPRIILTIAHLDHDPTNNGAPGRRPNLAALCQRCHNRHDAKTRAGHARATRRSKLAAKELF
jgi:5-methylcytosine-specific restriction endonuclease McrA